jgi:predicted GH43/DUF377 family glycosyl hydrolase
MPVQLLQQIVTPYKANRLVLQASYRQGEFDSHAIDCPFPFWHNGCYYMTYIGWDSMGYQTGLASSSDLLNWKKEGLIIGRGPAGSITEFNVALTNILRDNALFGRGELKKVRGRYLGTYHAYPRPGYEAGPATIGLCWSDNLREWEIGDPVLMAEDGAAWEHGGLYKSWIVEDGGRFYLFYNAKNQTEWPWVEQTGMAFSDDLVHWERCSGNPLLGNGAPGAFDDMFASDPVVLKDGESWVMFYFGNSSDGHARDGAAYSSDLLHWTKFDRILIDVGIVGSIDSLYAHKAGIIAKEGKLHHFYCAVAPTPVLISASTVQGSAAQHTETRGISVAWQ